MNCRILFSLAAALLLLAPAANADVITIDDFTDLVQVESVLPGAVPITNSTSQSGLSGVLGGERTTTATLITPGQLSGLGITVLGDAKLGIVPPDGILTISTDVDSDGVASLTYDGDLSSINLASLQPGTSGFLLEDVWTDVNSTDITFELSNVDGVFTSTQTVFGGVTQDLFFALSDFAGLTDSSLDSITLTLDTGAEVDLRLETLQLVTNTPEPASMILWSVLGVAGLGLARRRRLA